VKERRRKKQGGEELEIGVEIGWEEHHSYVDDACEERT